MLPVSAKQPSESRVSASAKEYFKTMEIEMLVKKMSGEVSFHNREVGAHGSR